MNIHPDTRVVIEKSENSKWGLFLIMLPDYDNYGGGVFKNSEVKQMVRIILKECEEYGIKYKHYENYKMSEGDIMLTWAELGEEYGN